MPWVEVFAVFVVSHLAGDFVVQTHWQAVHKFGGLGRDPRARRALLLHILTYTLTFVPALIWLADDLGAGVVPLAGLIAIPHLVQDDGRLLVAYNERAKGSDAHPGDPLFTWIDQAFHVIALFGTALVAAA